MRWILLAILALGGCPLTPSEPPENDAGEAYAYPLPRSDVANPVGTANTLDVATWNIEQFPRNAGTAQSVADLITSMNLDLIAVQEVTDQKAFEELDERLRDHVGLLSSHTYGNGTYQKIGFLYRDDILSLESSELIFAGQGYNFPRPPMQVRFVADGGNGTPLDFIAITIHLKAGLDSEDIQRREESIVSLANYVSGLQAPHILVLGDFNDVLTNADGLAVLAPFRTADFNFLTESVANGGAASFLPAGIMLDHQVSTVGMEDEIGANPTVIVPRLDLQVPNYEAQISDHLPVVVSIPVY